MVKVQLLMMMAVVIMEIFRMDKDMAMESVCHLVEMLVLLVSIGTAKNMVILGLDLRVNWLKRVNIRMEKRMERPKF